MCLRERVIQRQGEEVDGGAAGRSLGAGAAVCASVADSLLPVVLLASRVAFIPLSSSGSRAWHSNLSPVPDSQQKKCWKKINPISRKDRLEEAAAVDLKFETAVFLFFAVFLIPTAGSRRSHHPYLFRVKCYNHPHILLLLFKCLTAKQNTVSGVTYFFLLLRLLFSSLFFSTG